MIFRINTLPLAQLLLPVMMLLAIHNPSVRADRFRVLADGALPEDTRLGPLRTLNSYFPFRQVASSEAWHTRAAQLRRQVQVATGLWPAPTKTPLRARVHGPIDRDDYTVWRVAFESMPGHYVTGNLYRPKEPNGSSRRGEQANDAAPRRRPAILCPHGHWPGGRFHAHDDKELIRQISIGAERFLIGGRHPLQARCVQLARMGCIVFHYDMEGYADSIQRQHSVDASAHMGVSSGGTGDQSTADQWSMGSPRAELHLQNLAGLQTWNSVRALDFLTSLADVDPNRIAVTGASGGGTQTFLLMALDQRPAVAIPCVMVSTAMQGGCQCENASYLRIGAGNVDLAALAAPRPLGLTAADDWTVELETKGYPDLLSLYQMLGHGDQLRAVFHTQFKHNYNSVNRMFMYSFVNEALNLGFETPILERDYQPLTREEMTVWTDQNPAPSGIQVGEPHERALLGWWAEDSRGQLDPHGADRDAALAIVGSAWETILGRNSAEVGDIDLRVAATEQVEETAAELVLLTARKHSEQLPALMLPPPADWNRQVVLWLTDRGKGGLLSTQDKLVPAVGKLLKGGYAVVGVDLFQQGEFLRAQDRQAERPAADAGGLGEDWPWQRSADTSYGYNRPLFSLRVQDVLTTIRAIQSDSRGAQQIHLVGQGRAMGAVALAARVQAGPVVGRTAVATEGFRFASIERREDPMFLPGAVKYGGLDALQRLIGAAPLMVNEQTPQGDGPTMEKQRQSIGVRLAEWIMTQ
jgi:hypothetical protein